MNRRTFVLGASSILASCGNERRLNVYNWSDYIAPEAITGFQREFGVRVHYGTYESNQEMLAKVMSGNSGWDVVFPSEDFIGPMREMGLLAKIDHGRLSNLNALDSPFRTPPWDPQLAHCVPYMHGVTGIVYQKSVAQAPRSWADLWDRRFSGKLSMLDDQPEVFAACLKKLGYSLNSGDSMELVAAKSEAIQQKRVVRAYLNAEARDQLVSGDLLAAQAWAVTAAQAMSGAEGRLGFVLPSEGYPRFADNVAILKESRRLELAHQWIDYLLRPEVAAKIANVTLTATPNAEAWKRLQSRIREDPVLYPPAGELTRGEWFATPTAAAQRLRDRMWTEIKSA